MSKQKCNSCSYEAEEITNMIKHGNSTGVSSLGFVPRAFVCNPCWDRFHDYMRDNGPCHDSYLQWVKDGQTKQKPTNNSYKNNDPTDPLDFFRDKMGWQ